LQQPDAVVPERRVVQAELAERLAQVVVGLAGRRDPEPRIRRVERDAVEPIDPGERTGGLESPVVDLTLGVEPPRRHQERVLSLLPRAPVVLEAWVGGQDAIGRDVGGADFIGDVGDDLDADPEPAVARELEAEPPEVQDLLDGPREEDREERVVEGDLRVRRDRGRLGERVVAAEGQHAAVTPDAGEVGVLENVARAVHARALAVPHAKDAVVLGSGEEVGELAAVDRGRAEVLVEPGDEDDVVLAKEIRIALQGQVEPAEGRAPIAGDQRRGVDASAAVGAVLVERQPDERLDAGQEDEPLFSAVLGIEGEVARDRHRLLVRYGGAQAGANPAAHHGRRTATRRGRMRNYMSSTLARWAPGDASAASRVTRGAAKASARAT